MKHFVYTLCFFVMSYYFYSQNNADTLKQIKTNRFGVVLSNSFNDFTKGKIGNYYTHEHNVSLFYKRKNVGFTLGCSSIFNLEEGGSSPRKKIIILGPTAAINWDLYQYKNKFRFPLYIYYTFYLRNYTYGQGLPAHDYANSKGFKVGVDYLLDKKDKINPYLYFGPNYFVAGYDYRDYKGIVHGSISGQIVLCVDFGIKYYFK